MPERKKTIILIVEDEIAAALTMQQQLSGRDYEFVHCQTGDQALHIAERAQPDIIILDVLLPDIDGFEVCRRLRRQPLCAHVPILFYTNAHSIDDKLIGLRLGASDFLCKSADPRELSARIRHLLALKQSFDAMQELIVTDEVTGVYSRSYWEQRLEEECCRSRRFGRVFSCALVAIDGLSAIIQRYGEDAGRHAMTRLADLLRRQQEEAELLCRYDADMMAWLFPELNAAPVALRLEQTRDAAAALRVEAGGQVVALSVCCGVVSCSGRQSAAAVLEHLEIAVRTARRAGTGSVVVYGQETIHEC